MSELVCTACGKRIRTGLPGIHYSEIDVYCGTLVHEDTVRIEAVKAILEANGCKCQAFHLQYPKSRRCLACRIEEAIR